MAAKRATFELTGTWHFDDGPLDTLRSFSGSSVSRVTMTRKRSFNRPGLLDCRRPKEDPNAPPHSGGNQQHCPS